MQNKIPNYILQNNQITPEQKLALVGKKLMIGTPCYGGECSARYALALAAFQVTAARLNLHVEVEAILNESLVQRARNAIANQFMRSDCTHLLFIDADINFLPTAPIEMLLASQLGNAPLLGASYSKKEINWPMTETHIKNGVRTDQLAHCAGSHVVHRIKGSSDKLSAFELYPVQYLGTGFMLIERSVLKAIEPASRHYKNNHFPAMPIGDPMIAYFDCEVRNDNYLSEDYLFCARATDIGIVPRLCPWITLAHYGSYAFEGCFLCSQGGYVHDVKRANLTVKPKSNKMKQ